jgi:general secretion pathway protein D
VPSGLVTITDAQATQGYAVHIIPVRFASAKAHRETLNPFVSAGRSLAADEARNLLIFAGPGAEARDLVGLIDIFDVDWMAGMSFGIFPLKWANPEDVVNELKVRWSPMFGQRKGGVKRECRRGLEA